MNQAEDHTVRGNDSRGYTLGRLGRALFSLIILTLMLGALGSQAQTTDQHRRRLPVLDRLPTGSGVMAFTGSVKNLDLKGSVLQVTGARDGVDEYFPFKKSVHVSTADGKYATLDSVKRGWNVLVYYQEKDNGPSIKEIVVLGPPKAATAPPEPKAAPPPPSS